jgi:hypothetical protein
MTAPTFDGTFDHNWTAEILPHRPMILPRRHFVYPAVAEEVEKGALEVLIRPGNEGAEEPFLATCALGFRDPATPTGIWSMPNPDWLCAIAGGYAYLIDVQAPAKFTMLRYRPVLNVLSLADAGLILFIGHHAVLAWGRDGEAWESDRLSAEGITELRVDGNLLLGKGWDMRTDKDLPFALDLGNGEKILG